jgi:hypothetical protein
VSLVGGLVVGGLVVGGFVVGGLVVGGFVVGGLVVGGLVVGGLVDSDGPDPGELTVVTGGVPGGGVCGTVTGGSTCCASSTASWIASFMSGVGSLAPWTLEETMITVVLAWCWTLASRLVSLAASAPVAPSLASATACSAALTALARASTAGPT